MRIIKFLKAQPGIGVGEVAGYPAHVADRYIKAGVAEKVKDIDDPDTSPKAEHKIPTGSGSQAAAK